MVIAMEWILFGLIACLLAGGVGLNFRSRRLRKELDELRSNVGVFTEASIRVAQTLDGLLQGEVEPAQAHHASRRYLVNQAREGIRSGERLPQLAERLALSHDEVALLQTAAEASAA